MSPRVSVVMPAYQAESTVGAALESVLWQTYGDHELVVVDDGSTDATARIVEAHGDRVRLVQQENGGVAAARNRGIAEARGELIAFCDADDLLFPRHLEALVATYDTAGGGLATANSYWLFPGGIHPSKVRYKGRFPEPETQREAILGQNFVSTLALFPRALVELIGPFDEELRHAEDWDFWLRAIFAGTPVSLQRQPLALYRWGSTGLSSEREAMEAARRRVYAKTAERSDLTPAEQAAIELRLSGPGPLELGRQGDVALRDGRYREAAERYRAAAALAPSERALVWKARVLSVAPPLAGPLVRARQLRVERDVGYGDDQAR